MEAEFHSSVRVFCFFARLSSSLAIRDVLRVESRAVGLALWESLSVPRMEETSGKTLWRQPLSLMICLRDFPSNTLSSRPYLIDENRDVWGKLSERRGVSLGEKGQNRLRLIIPVFLGPCIDF